MKHKSKSKTESKKSAQSAQSAQNKPESKPTVVFVLWGLENLKHNLVFPKKKSTT